MKKLYSFAILSFVCISLSAQKYTLDLEKGIAEFEKQNYKEAYKYFIQANEKGYKTKKLSYYYAVCLYYNGDLKSKVENLLVKACMKKDFRAAVFYSVVYPHHSEYISQFIYSNEFSKDDFGEVFFCRANLEAKKAQQASKQLVFDQLNNSLKLGYQIPNMYIKNNPIEQLDKSQYYDVLGEFGINVVNLEIEDYVNFKIAQWQKKGKFEKTEDYKNRVTETNRALKAKELMQSYMNKLGSDEFNFSNSTNMYDADNEVFKIVFMNDKTIYLNVPLSEAPSFDQNFESLKYENATFTLSKNKPELMHVEIVNPANNKTYVYDSQEAIAFNSNQLNLTFDDINIEIDNSTSFGNVTTSKTSILNNSDVDENIPESGMANPNKFALIIGNENYQKYQTGLQAEQNVAFAVHDALTFKEYCIKTLGVPVDNIIFKANAGVVQMQQSLNQMNAIIKNMEGNAEVIVYYAGHGFPDQKSKVPYLIPVDVSSSSLELAIPLNRLVDKLSEHESKQVVVFLDACFTGGGREMGLLASRGVKIVPKQTNMHGNMVVFSASSNEQSALPHADMGHGMFTYYLLKKLQETKGAITLGELDTYLSKEVAIKSTLLHSREQNPKTHYSPVVSEEWSSWRLD